MRPCQLQAAGQCTTIEPRGGSAPGEAPLALEDVPESCFYILCWVVILPQLGGRAGRKERGIFAGHGKGCRIVLAVGLLLSKLFGAETLGNNEKNLTFWRLRIVSHLSPVVGKILLVIVLR